MFAQIAPKTLQAGPFAAAGKGGPGIHHPAREIGDAPFAETGHAIVSGQDWIDEGMVTVGEIEHRAIPPDEINEKTDRLFKHRLAQFVVEAFESLAVNGVVFFKPAKVQPVAPELRSQSL